MGNKNITANVYRIKAHYSMMCGYFCIGLIDYVFKGQTLTDFTDFFSLEKKRNIRKFKERSMFIF